LNQLFAKGQRLLERFMKLKTFCELYKDELKKLMATHFAKEAIARDMAQFRKAVEPIVREDE
tara:strand:- start:902 stop:1087 length:186 start_codon:yes stop_codon:yes gene_type:complete